MPLLRRRGSSLSIFERPLLRLLPLGQVCLVAAILSASLLTSRCAAHAQRTLRVAAAADLQPLLPHILDTFQAQTSIKVEASYQSSAVLATQILNGAPFDLFLAADLSFPQRVIAAGLADSDQPVLYAKGTLVLFARNDSRYKQLSLDALKDPSLQRLAVANPDHAPYGRAARAAIEKMGLGPSLDSKLVVAENIAQTAQFVESGNAELGLISLTSAGSDRLRAIGNYVEVPRDDYPPILQGAVVIKRSGNRDGAHRLLDFLLSPEIQKELAAHGLSPARDESAR